MGRRRFGYLQKKPNKKNPRYLEASYEPPVWAYRKWPDQLRGKKRIYKNFPLRFAIDAETWLNDAERDIIRGTWVPPQLEQLKEEAHDTTFAQYATDYLREHRKANGEPLAEQTVEKYRQYLRDHLIPALGVYRMDEITESLLRETIDSMDVSGDGAGASIRWHVATLMRAMFVEASTKKVKGTGEPLIGSNPAINIRVEKPLADIADADVSHEELDMLYAAMPERHALVIYLVGVLCLRPEEVYGLQRGDIDINPDRQGGMVRVRRAAISIKKDGRTVRGYGKTKTPGSVRDVAIPKYLGPCFEQHLEKFVGPLPESPMFTGSVTHDIVNPQSVRNAWYRARKTIPRLEEKKVRLYDLRHRALTEVASYTNSLKAVMEMGGHTQVSTAMHYQHVTEKERRKILAGIEADANAARMKRAAATNDGDGMNTPPYDEIESLSRNLEQMDPKVRANVLRSMEEGRRSLILSHFSEEAQIETMAKLLSES